MTNKKAWGAPPEPSKIELALLIVAIPVLAWVIWELKSDDWVEWLKQLF